MRPTPEPLLNLSSMFEDALAVLDDGIPLSVPPLPAAVFMMQRDVINHYRHALTHYLCVPLDSDFLQGSSLGTPYVKWAKFTNDDFESLGFTILNLLRYTSRLVHERQPPSFQSQIGSEVLLRRHREHIDLSNVYTLFLCDTQSSDRSIGVRVESDLVVVITPFSRGPRVEHRCSIQERAVLHTLQERGLHELELLDRLNLEFAERARARYRDISAIEVFDRMHESWCM